MTPGKTGNAAARRNGFEGRVGEEIRAAASREFAVELGNVHVERPNEASHGDFASNVALANAKAFRRNPREVAEKLAAAIDAPFISLVEVAGPGFLNFRISPEATWNGISGLLAEGERYGRDEPSGEAANVEFVSANPTGPMHVGHGRQAAYGDSLARMLEAAGRRVSREYYFNDGGNQMRLSAETVAVEYAKLFDEAWPVADEGALYKGEYNADIARDLMKAHGREYLDADREAGLAAIGLFAADWCMNDIRRTLDRVGVRFDTYFNEKTLYSDGRIEATIRELRDNGHTFDADGALWLRATELGDDKDRVLVKSDGSYTYAAPDIAYHRDKWGRGFRTAINVLGADHAGYFQRLNAGIVALGLPGDFLDVEIVRLVKLTRDGELVKFSKRSGNVVALDELIDEVGVDVVRYFYVRSSHKTEMNFDLDLAIKESEENPVFYVQYAHARIASIFRRAGTEPRTLVGANLEAADLTEGERALANELFDYPRVVRNAAGKREVHLLPAYLEALATRFHQFYAHNRVLVDDEATKNRRLALCAATKSVIANGLDLLGVSAPEEM
ncbi:arginine--tRNA ligase [Rubrobacter indicoceani]|uniref:arginine--tRNA ligase n=1 Tax=Rubrobacter indicoceani TaxID=2051957 RepID=UPI000E5B9A22|nr:arginine--tRNA ligase [Rubrobacter indicoceani]